MIVAIDGPASSGKSTTARRVAEVLDYLYLDTGAMYRAIALGFLRHEAQPTDAEAAQLLPKLHVRVAHEAGEMQVYLNEENVSGKIRVQEVGAMASKVSSLLAVREKLVAVQRREAYKHVEATGGVVLDGRDIGTEVLPDADVKIFLVADIDERARRRHSELMERGEEVSYGEVIEEIAERDALDRERQHAPLRKADDAIELDTTECTIDEQVAFVVDQIRERAQQGAR